MEEPRLIARARIALDDLTKAGALRGDAVLHYRDDALWRKEGLLRDPLALATAALDLHTATREKRWLDLSLRLAEGLVSRFEDPADGALVDLHRSGDGAAHPPVVPDKLVEQNGEAAALLLRLAAALDRDDLEARARRILSSLSPTAGGFGVFAAPFGSALLALTEGVLVVDTTAARLDGDGEKLSRRAVALALAVGPCALKAGAAGDATGASGVAFCVRDRCSTRTSAAAELKRTLASVLPLHEDI